MKFITNGKEFAVEAVRAFIADYQAKKNDDYEIDMAKCDQINDVIAYCKMLQDTRPDCKIIRCMLEPKHRQAYVQVLFSGEFTLSGENSSLAEFVNAIKLCDGVNITTNPAGDDFFQITFFVEDLWSPIEK